MELDLLLFSKCVLFIPPVLITYSGPRLLDAHTNLGIRTRASPGKGSEEKI